MKIWLHLVFSIEFSFRFQQYLHEEDYSMFHMFHIMLQLVMPWFRFYSLDIYDDVYLLCELLRHSITVVT